MEEIRAPLGLDHPRSAANPCHSAAGRRAFARYARRESTPNQTRFRSVPDHFVRNHKQNNSWPYRIDSVPWPSRRPNPRLATLFTYMRETDHLRRIRFWLAAFIAGLVVSGVTAFPLQSELRWLVSFLHADSLQSIAESTGLLPWIERVYIALSITNARYPFLAYGTDWLAF